MKETFSFLSQLKRNNNREWFLQHKATCDRLRALFFEQVEQLIARMSVYDDTLTGLDAKSCIFRIYRDIRFSPDKTPYKAYFSAYLAQGGRKSPRAGYYLHIEPGNCLLCGGIWNPEPRLLKALRQAVYENIDEWLEIVEDPSFRKVFTHFDGDLLKKVPAPFPREWEHAEWLKRKDYAIVGGLPDTFFENPDWIEAVASDFRLAKPMNDFLNYTVDEYLG